jgi:arsenic resistance protein ArsH
MEELIKFTLLTWASSGYLVKRYSERKETDEELIKRAKQTAI